MKLTNIIIGFFVFSIVCSLFFAAAYELLRYDTPEAANKFNSLAGEYKSISDDFDAQTQQVSNKSKQKTAGSLTADVEAYTGAFSGIQLAGNFFFNFEHIVNNATGDMNEGEGYIDNRIINGILTILLIIIALSILFFIRGFKAET